MLESKTRVSLFILALATDIPLFRVQGSSIRVLRRRHATPGGWHAASHWGQVGRGERVGKRERAGGQEGGRDGGRGTGVGGRGEEREGVSFAPSWKKRRERGYIYVCMCACVHVCMCVCVCVNNTYTYVYTYMHTCVCVCVCAYVYAYFMCLFKEKNDGKEHSSSGKVCVRERDSEREREGGREEWREGGREGRREGGREKRRVPAHKEGKGESQRASGIGVVVGDAPIESQKSFHCPSIAM
jgi:hypothetical protein